MNGYGLDIAPNANDLSFSYGPGVIGPASEIRRLDDIRASLPNPKAAGPENLYGIVMDVHRAQDKDALLARNLLFGAVVYTGGKIGDGPVRSQGHKHAVSPSCGRSTPEVYEIWEGEAIVYMQHFAGCDAGKCMAVHAKAGDVVVVPPEWVHQAINASADKPMSFGAWCVRDYGFDYEKVRAMGGMAFYPKFSDDGIKWFFNDKYSSGDISEVSAVSYPELGIKTGIPVYRQFVDNSDAFLFVSNPLLADDVWKVMNAKA